jgi:hypothetical protein
MLVDLLISILAFIAIIFGIGVLFAKGLGNFLAGGICIFAGMYAFDTKTFWPLILGFAGLWVLRILGFEER